MPRHYRKFFFKILRWEKSIVLVSSSTGFEEVETVVDLNEMEESITTSLPSNNVLREVIVVASIKIMGAVRFVGLLGRLVFKEEQVLVMPFGTRFFRQLNFRNYILAR